MITIPDVVKRRSGNVSSTMSILCKSELSILDNKCLKISLVSLFLFIASTIFSPYHLQAQNQQFLDKNFYLVDSLTADMLSEHDKHLLDSLFINYKKEKVDTIYFNKLLEITENLRSKKVAKLYNDLLFLEVNYSLSKANKETEVVLNKLKKFKIKTLSFIGEYNYELGNYEKCKEVDHEGLKIAREIKDTALIGNMLMELATDYTMLGQTDKALSQYERALELNDKVDDKEGRSGIYVWMGYVYNLQGNVEKALEYYNKALKIDEELGLEGPIANRLTLIGSIYLSQGDTANALTNYSKSLDISRKIDSKRRIAINLEILGGIYLSQKKYNNALINYFEALSLFSEINHYRSTTSTYSNIGKVYYKKGKIDSALYYLDLSVQKAREGQAIGDLPEILVDYAKVLKEIGDVKKAHQLAKEAYQVASELGYPSSISSSSKLLSETSVGFGDYKTALEMYKLSIQMRDSVKNETNKKATYKQQMKYEYEKKEEALKAEEAKRVLEAERDRKVRNTIIIGIGCGLGLSLVFLYYLYGRFKVIRKQKHLIEEQSANLKSAYNELHELQQFKDGMTGMIVHDLKNPLNAMLGYAEEVDSVNLKTRIRNTSRMMLNYVLNMLDVQKFESKEVPLDKAEQPFSNVLQSAIEQIEFLAQEKNIMLENKVKRNYIVNLDAELVIRVLVNLLTNAIKYSPNKSTISIDAHAKENNQLEIMVADQGQGIPKDMLSKVFDKYTQVEAKKSGKVKSTGLGLTFCKLVAEGHGGRIWVESDEGNGSQFYFTIPLVSDAGEILKSNTSTELTEKLSTEELSFLKPIKKQLSQLDVMDSMEIMEVLEQTRKSKSMAINSWANQVENAVLNMDEERFKQLIV